MLERTLLYPQVLRGVESGQVQSLLSFLEHLAMAHSCKPRRLLERLCSTGPVERSAAEVLMIYKRVAVHGTSPMTIWLRKRLERATGTDLSLSTLDRFESVLASSQLIKRETFYCPCCVQETREATYSRLLWCVECVYVCPIHKVRLRRAAVCGAPESEHLCRQNRPLLGSVCGKCGSIGHRCVTEAPEPATVEKLWVAQQVQRLLELPMEEVRSLSLESFRQGLQAVMDADYGGSPVKAALESNCGRTTIFNWTKGGRPALPSLLRLCAHSKIDVIALLKGRRQLLTLGDGGKYDVLKRGYSKRRDDKDELRQKLLDAASLPVPPSVKEFARSNGLYIEYPRRHFRKESDLLAEAHRLHLKKRWEYRHNEQRAAFCAAASSLRERGEVVTSKAVQKEAGIIVFSQNQRRMRSLYEALESAQQPEMEVVHQ